MCEAFCSTNHTTANDLSEFLSAKNCLFVFGGDTSTPRHNVRGWEIFQKVAPHRTLKIVDESKTHFSYMRSDRVGRVSTIGFRDIDSLIGDFDNIICDVTGLQASTWVPLITAAIRLSRNLQFLYNEPENYCHRVEPVAFSWYDLSARTEPFSQLPGAVRLANATDVHDPILTVLIGFEGIRTRKALNTFDPIPTVVPVVGLPGYRAEYPANSVSANSDIFGGYSSIETPEFAEASCPFSAMAALRSIRRSYPNRTIVVAPVGTKPHQIGALLFLLNDTRVNVIFDFPKPRTNQTVGIARIHRYIVVEGGTVVA